MKITNRLIESDLNLDEGIKCLFVPKIGLLVRSFGPKAFTSDFSLSLACLLAMKIVNRLRSCICRARTFSAQGYI